MTRARQLAALAGLYTAQGLPYGFFTQALPVILREAGYSLKAISLLSLLYLPWALKFLWAPLLDARQDRRRWLLGLQWASVGSALILGVLPFEGHLGALIVGAFVLTALAASQDVLTDGLAVRVLATADRGLGNGLQVGAYRVGMILGGGLLLWIFARASWAATFAGMGLLLALFSLPLALARSFDADPHRKTPSIRELALGWLSRARAPGVLAFAGLLFAYRFGDAMVSNVLGPFLKDSGLSKEAIAVLKGVVGSSSSLVGAAVGAWLAFRITRRNLILSGGLAQAVSFALYVLSALGVGGLSLLWVATILEGVLGTIATVTLFTLMMDASDPEHAGVDYTLLASILVLVNGLGTFASGAIVDAFGYPPAFGLGMLLAVAGCLFVVTTLDRRSVPPRLGAVWPLRVRDSQAD